MYLAGTDEQILLSSCMIMMEGFDKKDLIVEPNNLTPPNFFYQNNMIIIFSPIYDLIKLVGSYAQVTSIEKSLRN